MSVNCPECDQAFTLDNTLRGGIAVCPDCGMEQEVAAASLPTAVVPEEQEDSSQ